MQKNGTNKTNMILTYKYTLTKRQILDDFSTFQTNMTCKKRQLWKLWNAMDKPPSGFLREFNSQNHTCPVLM